MTNQSVFQLSNAIFIDYEWVCNHLTLVLTIIKNLIIDIAHFPLVFQIEGILHMK